MFGDNLNTSLMNTSITTLEQNPFTESFSQWGHVGAMVAWGNKQRACSNHTRRELNKNMVIILKDSRLTEEVVPMDQLYPLFCEVCQNHSFRGLVLCNDPLLRKKGCEHRQCPKCMEKYKNKCGFGCTATENSNSTSNKHIVPIKKTRGKAFLLPSQLGKHEYTLSPDGGSRMSIGQLLECILRESNGESGESNG